MNVLVVLLFVSVFSLEYALRLELVGALWTLVPELLSGIALLVVLGRFLVTRKLALSGRYLVFLLALMLVMRRVGCNMSIMALKKEIN